MDIPAVRAAVATAAEDAAGTTGLACFAYAPDSITPPVFYVEEIASIDYVGDDLPLNHGLYELTLQCKVLVSRSDDKNGQAILDAFLSGGTDSSIRDAIEADGTLGGECSDLMVTGVQDYGNHGVGTSDYLGANLVVRVIGGG